MNDNRDGFLLAAMEAAVVRAKLLQNGLAVMGVMLPRNPEGVITGALFAAIAEAGVATCRHAPKVGKSGMADIAKLKGADIEQWAKKHFGATILVPKGGN